MARYGIPYQGSKNQIAEWVVSYLPKADTLVDLFAGGCAITHCAMEKGKYNNYIVNDVNTAPKLFVDAINGKYNSKNIDETYCYTREENIVIVSEYTQPPNTVEIACKEKRSILSATNNSTIKLEKLFVNKKCYDKYMELINGEQS